MPATISNERVNAEATWKKLTNVLYRIKTQSDLVQTLHFQDKVEFPEIALTDVARLEMAMYIIEDIAKDMKSR